MARHTAGPWNVEGNDIVGERYICELTNWHITAAGGSYDEINAQLQQERAANAALIAAAPELLDALKGLIKVYGITDTGSYERFALQAVAKAEGCEQ